MLNTILLNNSTLILLCLIAGELLLFSGFFILKRKIKRLREDPKQPNIVPAEPGDEKFDRIKAHIDAQIALSLNARIDDIKALTTSLHSTTVTSEEKGTVERPEKEVQGQLTDITNVTHIYSQIRSRKYSEDALVFKRVRLEFIAGTSLSDLGRERLFEEHSSGNCIIATSAEGRLLLYPYFRKEEMEDELMAFFNGRSSFSKVIMPAQCQSVFEKYQVITKGTLD